MRILMAMHSLAMGGAEKFFTNLASALAEHHEVTCYIPALRCSDPVMVERLGDVRVSSLWWLTPLTYRVFYKLTLMIQKQHPTFDPESAMHTRHLQRLHERHSFNVVNAHLMPGARQVCTAFKDHRLPVTKSDHGDTARFDAKADGMVFQRLDALICPSPANTQRAQTLPLRNDCRVLTIPYGYRKSESATTALPPFEGITFGMVARGVADKGWREAIAAARITRAQAHQSLRLVLVGEGKAINELRNELSAEDRTWIILTGQQHDPERWIRGFDVGLLPTCLPEESLPNTIIEYLACGKPVIATDVGGIASMIGQAGSVIPLVSDGRANVAALAAAMIEMTDATRRNAIARHAPDAFASFDLASCVQAYETLFAQLLAR